MGANVAHARQGSIVTPRPGKLDCIPFVVDVSFVRLRVTNLVKIQLDTEEMGKIERQSCRLYFRVQD